MIFRSRHSPPSFCSLLAGLSQSSVRQPCDLATHKASRSLVPSFRKLNGDRVRYRAFRSPRLARGSLARQRGKSRPCRLDCSGHRDDEVHSSCQPRLRPRGGWWRARGGLRSNRWQQTDSSHHRAERSDELSRSAVACPSLTSLPGGKGGIQRPSKSCHSAGEPERSEGGHKDGERSEAV